MIALKKARERRGVSQRRLAKLAGISYKTIQLIESGKQDPKMSTLQKIASVLGYAPTAFSDEIEFFFSVPGDSVRSFSQRLRIEGEESWRDHFFDFIESFCRTKDICYVVHPPVFDTSGRMKALLASTVETLCYEMDIPTPFWCYDIPALIDAWSVSEKEKLTQVDLGRKSFAFRKRNIWVLNNFLPMRNVD